MTSPIILIAWVGLSVIMCLLGKLADSKVLVGIGACMLVMTCAIV